MLTATRFFRSAETGLLKSVSAGMTQPLPAGLLKRFLNNSVATKFITRMHRRRFESIPDDLIAGAPAALQYLARHVAAKDFNAINLCAEESFAKKIEQELSAEANTGWEISKIINTQLGSLNVIIGAVRGDKVDPNLLRTMFGLQFVVVDIDKVMEEKGLFELPSLHELQVDKLNGMIIQADMLVDVEQTTSSEEISKQVRHWLKLEMSIIPHSEAATEFRPTSNPTEEPPLLVAFEPTDWKIVDLNNFMRGNSPIVAP
jgi:hypothetical protein